VPGRLKPHVACPTTSGTGSETTGIAIFTLTALNAKTGIISRRLIPDVALIDPEVTTSLPGKVVAASGFDCLHHALESITSRAYVRRLNPARGTSRPVSQGANPFSDALAFQAIESVGRFLVRAASDASDREARTEMMYAATLAGIAFNAAGCHLPHGLSYAVSGLVKDYHVDGYPQGKGLVPHGMAVTLHGPSVFRWTADACPERHLDAARILGVEVRGAGPRDAGEALAGGIIALMRAAGMPNGLNDLGLDAGHLDALATGAEPQWRVIRNAPKDVGREDLKTMFDGAMRYW
jgi:alcohol dehydrogenase class IV